MNALTVVVFCIAVAAASAGHLGFGLAGLGGHGALGYAAAPVNPAAHITSGSVSVGPNGAVVAGPAGSVRTDNGLHGHGAGANVAGPAGDVRTQGGHAVLAGPGLNVHGAGFAGHGAGFGGHGAGFGYGPALAGPVGYAGFGGFGGLGGHGFGAHGLVGHGHGHGW